MPLRRLVVVAVVAEVVDIAEEKSRMLGWLRSYAKPLSGSNSVALSLSDVSRVELIIYVLHQRRGQSGGE